MLQGSSAVGPIDQAEAMDAASGWFSPKLKALLPLLVRGNGQSAGGGGGGRAAVMVFVERKVQEGGGGRQVGRHACGKAALPGR